MKRLLLALMPWMAVTSVARAQALANVVFTHLGPIKEHCVRVADECFVPFAFLDAVGWGYVAKGDELVVTADEQHVTVGARDIAGISMVPLRHLMDKLGGDTAWQGNQLIALSQLAQVQVRDGGFSIRSRLAIRPRVFTMTDPNRVVVDLEGAKLMPNTKIDLEGAARISQFKPNVVRVVLETDFDDLIAKRKFAPGCNFDISVVGGSSGVGSNGDMRHDGPAGGTAKSVQAGPRVPLTQPQKNVYDPASDPDMAPPVTPSRGGATVGPLTVDSENPKSTTMILKIVGGKQVMPTVRRPEADTVEISLPGASADGADFSSVKSSAILNVAARDEGGGVVLTLNLVRPMGMELSLMGADLRIQLFRPSTGDGSLAGKVVVVDPGHGGQDSGTQAAGYREKDLTLAIGKLLSQKLTDEGATVIMTRKTDVFIPLDDRPAIANRNGADFFISVHINSNELDNSASGTITFYHSHDPICRLMADCIEHEIVKVNGIGGMGTWSDTKVHHSGFAVLRGAKMPAVLIECGFLNTSKDRARMLTDDFQNDVSSAIVRGLKTYLIDADNQRAQGRIVRK